MCVKQCVNSADKSLNGKHAEWEKKKTGSKGVSAKEERKDRGRKREREWCLGLGLCTCESTSGLFFTNQSNSPALPNRLSLRGWRRAPQQSLLDGRRLGLRLSHQDHCLSCLFVALGRKSAREKNALFQVLFLSPLSHMWGLLWVLGCKNTEALWCRRCYQAPSEMECRRSALKPTCRVLFCWRTTNVSGCWRERRGSIL